jgi:hypothetical protein
LANCSGRMLQRTQVPHKRRGFRASRDTVYIQAQASPLKVPLSPDPRLDSDIAKTQFLRMTD